MVDKTPCLVKGLLLMAIRNPKLSDCTHHCTPKARSTGKSSQAKAIDLTSFDRSVSGMLTTVAGELGEAESALLARLTKAFNQLHRCTF